MQTHTPFVGVDAHIDPCSRHNRFYETLRQKRVYPTGGQGRPPLRVRSCSHRYTKICNVVPRGRGRTPPLRQNNYLFTIHDYFLPQFAPPLRYDETWRQLKNKNPSPHQSASRTAFPPPQGKPKAPAGGFPRASFFMKTAPCLFCPLCTSHHNPAVSPAPACPGCRFRSQNPPWSRGRCR